MKTYNVYNAQGIAMMDLSKKEKMKHYALLTIICIAPIYGADREVDIQKQFLNTVSIELLKDYPEHIDTLVRIWYDVLGKNHFPLFEMIKNDYASMLRSQMQDTELPIAFVALVHGAPIGICSLRPTCVPRPGVIPWSDQNPDKKPWLACFVAAIYQQHGVGTKLVQTAMHYAHEKFGFNEAYLVPSSSEIEQLYRAKGCQEVAQTTFHGKSTPVMKIDFNKMLTNFETKD